MKVMKKIKISYLGDVSSNFLEFFTTKLNLDSELECNISVLCNDKNSDNQFHMSKEIEKLNLLYNATFFHIDENIDRVLNDADFVILNYKLDNNSSIKHAFSLLQENGIFQSQTNIIGPYAQIQELTIVPKIKILATKIIENCPKAWVINVGELNSAILRTLYQAYPEIKAFGATSDVEKTKALLGEISGCDSESKIFANVLGIDGFSCITYARKNDENLFPIYEKYSHNCLKNDIDKQTEKCNLVKFDLFERFNCIICSKEDEVVEFCPKNWYVEKQKNKISDFSDNFALITNCIICQIKAICGYESKTFATTLPQISQIEGIPTGVIVLTDAKFSLDSVKPTFGGNLPNGIKLLLMPSIYERELMFKAAYYGNYDLAFQAFACSDKVSLSFEKSKILFNVLLKSIKNELPFYDKWNKEDK